MPAVLEIAFIFTVAAAIAAVVLWRPNRFGHDYVGRHRRD